LLEGSQYADGDADTDPQRLPPQDPYSIRCTPAAFAAFHDALGYAQRAVEVELNAVTDNPLFLDISRDYAVVSGGHFHGDPIAIPMDALKIALTKLGSLCERQIFKLTDFESRGVPPMLLAVDQSRHGLNSGFMILQYTAAALVNECSTLSHPSSVHSIPSSANQEDYVSMSMNAARHCRKVLENVERIVAQLLLSAAQAIDAQQMDPEKLAPKTRAVYDAVRKAAPMLQEDRAMYPDVEAVLELLHCDGF
jgi:histidine ammonia-lyase